MKQLLLCFFLFSSFNLLAQKKPLDHSAYDSWQSIGERMISNDGKWVVYTVNVQEGDNDLVIQSSDGSSYKKQIPRGYNAVITEDNKFVVFRIRPLYKETRDARIKKKRPDEFPKDSIGIVELGKNDVIKVAKVRSYKTPQKASGWLAYHKEKEPVPPVRAAVPTQKTVDSLRKTIDSLSLLVKELRNIKGGNRDSEDADEDPVSGAAGGDGSDLVLRNLATGKDRVFKNVAEYYFNANGQKLVMEINRAVRDTNSINGVVVYDLAKGKLDTITRGGNDFRNFAISEDGSKIAFVAERDTAKKALQKFYQLHLYRTNDDSAWVLCDKKTQGMKVGMTVSENGSLSFSKSGNRLFFGTAPIQPPKDTSLIEIDLVKLDIWHYKDDYLQTQQLFNLNNELRRSYLAVYDFNDNKIEQLASPEFPNVLQTAEGDGAVFIAVTDTGRRVQRQWGDNKTDIYAVDVKTGVKTLVKGNHEGSIYPSSTGKYILLYDAKAKHYFAWDGKVLKNITSKIKVPLYNEEHDSPSDPPSYGIMRWKEGDEAVYVYDRYGVWEVDPTGVQAPKLFLDGRKNKTIYRYVQLDPEERFIKSNSELMFRAVNHTNKQSGLYRFENGKLSPVVAPGAVAIGTVAKPKNSESLLFTKENFVQSPNLYLLASNNQFRLSDINTQQSQYNWGTAELYKWKTFNGKEHSGILYKPEDFDSTKKYPVIFYFYETHSNELHQYQAPSPTPSRLNIPFYVSRGYIVFSPDIIYYTKGHPAKDAYNAVVSVAQNLGKKKWVDGKNMAIQGQSWGGIQVAQLITMTDMFKAAWAGAPVANMTSAYGGIRWESGANRQFQYEKTQSRIGATLWERPDLYIANSPLFHLPKVKTPLVIMANDADGAVPWYQGIELFTAMRRLNKQVWMLNYNGEAHNLVDRRNRKDIQVRQQQFFDWLLKGEKPAKWIVEGVPAVKKGREWGLEIVH
jgi:dipeptidyl aminopeptidase/acylaminoacyl peptidase